MQNFWRGFKKQASAEASLFEQWKEEVREKEEELKAEKKEQMRSRADAQDVALACTPDTYYRQ